MLFLLNLSANSSLQGMIWQIWQCMEIFFVFTAVEDRWEECYASVGRARMLLNISPCKGKCPQQKYRALVWTVGSTELEEAGC